MVCVAGSTACASARGMAELCLKLEMRSVRIELFDIVNVQMNWTRHCATASPSWDAKQNARPFVNFHAIACRHSSVTEHAPRKDETEV